MCTSCKRANRILNKVSKYSNEKHELKLTNKIFNYFGNILNKIIICILFVIATPIVILGVLYNYIFNGKMLFRLPKSILRKAEPVIKNELE